MTYLSEPVFVQLSANVATALFAIFIGVQLLAAAGVFPVSMLWGGRQTELTLRMRLTSVVAAVVLGDFGRFYLHYSLPGGAAGQRAVANGRSHCRLGSDGLHGAEHGGQLCLR